MRPVGDALRIQIIVCASDQCALVLIELLMWAFRDGDESSVAILHKKAHPFEVIEETPNLRSRADLGQELLLKLSVGRDECNRLHWCWGQKPGCDVEMGGGLRDRKNVLSRASGKSDGLRNSPSSRQNCAF